MQDRHILDGQMYSFLQRFYNAEKFGLSWRLDSIIRDNVLLNSWLIISI